MKRVALIGCVLSGALSAFGCSKTSGEVATSGRTEATSGRTDTAPAKAIAGASSSAANPSSPAPSAAKSASAAADPETPEAARKRAQIEWAIRQDQIKSDPDGQWATEANASSAYNDAQGTASFSPSQATGVPNVESFGSSASAWTPKTPDGGIEWLELRYIKPVYAKALRVRESYGPGAVIKVELFDENGVPHVVWTGADATKDLNYLIVEYPKTAYKTNRVRITLATNAVPGWNAIDAVQLIGTEQ